MFVKLDADMSSKFLMNKRVLMMMMILQECNLLPLTCHLNYYVSFCCVCHEAIKGGWNGKGLDRFRLNQRRLSAVGWSQMDLV